MALFSAYRNDKQKINKWYEKFGKNDSRHISYYSIRNQYEYRYYGLPRSNIIFLPTVQWCLYTLSNLHIINVDDKSSLQTHTKKTFSTKVLLAEIYKGPPQMGFTYDRILIYIFLSKSNQTRISLAAPSWQVYKTRRVFPLLVRG